MIFEPTLDRVLIKKETKTKTESGLILPESATSNAPSKAEVVAVGPGMSYFNSTTNTLVNVKCKAEVGDSVLVPSVFNLTEIELDNEKYYLIKDGEILGFLNK